MFGSIRLFVNNNKIDLGQSLLTYIYYITKRIIIYRLNKFTIFMVCQYGINDK